MLLLLNILFFINFSECASGDYDTDYMKLNNSSSELLDSDFANTDMTEFKKKLSKGGTANFQKKKRYERSKELWNRTFKDNAICHDSDSDVSRGILSDYCRRKRLNRPDSSYDAKNTHREKMLKRELVGNDDDDTDDFVANKVADIVTKLVQNSGNDEMKPSNTTKFLENAARQRLQNLDTDGEADTSSDSSYERMRTRVSSAQKKKAAAKKSEKQGKSPVKGDEEEQKEKDRKVKEMEERFAKVALQRKKQLKIRGLDSDE